MEQTLECGGCGRFYPSLFPCCPFCYVQEFLEVEAKDDHCPVCGSSDQQTHCPECGKDYNGSHYCLYCGHIKGKGGAY